MIDKKLKKYSKIANEIQKLSESYQKLTDDELKFKTISFKQRLVEGIGLENLLIEAYAVIIEADYRVLGIRPYYVQILGGIALFYGNVAEMKTGEGKTLTATMPLYLRGLTGKGNFLITSNSYLAWRDAEDVGKVYKWLGLTCSVGVVKDNSEDEIDKELVYNSDIVYTTHSALGFDYLFDNLTTTIEEQFVTNFNFVLIDEIDAILLDMAQVPLVISGAPKVQSNLFKLSDILVKGLVNDEDFEISEDMKNVWFLKSGIEKIEKQLGIQNILSEKWQDLYRHLVLALRANYLLFKDRDYIVEAGEIMLLDVANGRKLEGNKLQAGFHQALEAKEGLEITEESRSMGSITYQNLFKKFKTIAGMTGTAMTDAEEFRETYQMDVVEIPTNKPLCRVDHPDQIFLTNEAKMKASLEVVKEAIKSQRPILIGTSSVSMSNLYSLMLLENQIPHSVLNASSTAKESLIISESGNKGIVTVATSMAGRGTDIKLDDETRSLGGLLILGTERMTSSRVDNQLRGRAGRQGDPGDSMFFVSLEDKIVLENSPSWVSKIKGKFEKSASKNGEAILEEPLDSKKYGRVISRSQKYLKNQEVEGRKQVLEYDGIIDLQREKIYKMRNRIMGANEDYLDRIIKYSNQQSIEVFVSNKENLTKLKVIDFIYNYLDYNFDYSLIGQIEKFSDKIIKIFLNKIIEDKIHDLPKMIPDRVQLVYFKRLIILKAIDSMWIEQSDNLQQLKSVVSARGWGQHKPIYEFQEESQKSFIEMENEISENVMRNLLLSELINNEDGSIEIEFP
ncbi:MULTISPECIES: accessory Sec system translocase SecA2 [unclassified Enterococcus]|uniref:accessory Sec system translocase SecA2 n=1 Tax=unclassified Enterococcus TaxID=2608891 RepID=UPI001555A01F|nr:MULTISPECIES: accessory Sec system translocase SecA2 [unclassified Enterococcus]MBS7576332.1 accessory Sec system translocase SecA2 [Enterococcus sp. MMGLQ5-2]MBS7583564.1 accessory Sec system translocase SecA2 [Enterococcus sp. MMGLQ5-1]NPD11426.1 accessory Sec system translocase SecA2 [Enterococcus sp. MMGLQ5-1]NPD36170.1 accessory Sec system translocase SecA2 [Enterococcus sp. MMGLQ5-2]